MNLRLLTISLVALPVSLTFARESIHPLRLPESSIQLGGYGELLDDVYSADMQMDAEYAPCNCLSLYVDASYRFVSYEFDTMLHDQRHEAVNLEVNGFNETYVGAKFVPYSFFGVDVNWRFPPGDGSEANRFSRLGIEPFYLYNFSRSLSLGASAGYYTYLESDNFQSGDELGLKASLEWRLAYDSENRCGWLLDYVFLYRFRIQESKNLNLEKDYQKMDDLYRGFRMRMDAARYFSLKTHSLGIALYYEMNRGNLFGMETGHSVGLYIRFVY